MLCVNIHVQIHITHDILQFMCHFYCLVCKGIKLSVLEKLYIKYIPFDSVHEHRRSAHACLKV